MDLCLNLFPKMQAVWRQPLSSHQLQPFCINGKSRLIFRQSPSICFAKCHTFCIDLHEQSFILSVDDFFFFILRNELAFLASAQAPLSTPLPCSFINMSTLLLNTKGFSRKQFYYICLGVIWIFGMEIESTKIDLVDLWDISVFNSPSVCADTMQSRNEASGSPTFHLWTLAPDVNHS